MKSPKLLIEAFFATTLVFVVIWLLFVIFSLSVKPLNFVANSLKEIHLSDIYFSHIQDEKVDTTITLINIAELHRNDIATLLDVVASKKPKVVGLDVMFSNRINYQKGLDSIKRVGSRFQDLIVFSSYLTKTDENPGQEGKKIDKDFHYFQGKLKGHINLVSDLKRTQPVRYFYPAYRTLDADTIHSFTSVIASVISPPHSDYLKDRYNDKEIINYFGGSESFRTIEGNDILHGNFNHYSLIRDKIVLMGFLGAGKFGQLDDLSDKYYSPLNKTFYGRSHPDIYGLVIHANILKMILDQTFIDRPSQWIMNSITVVIVYLHMLPFLYFFVKQHLWYHIAAKLIQLVSLVLIVASIFFCMGQYSLLPDMTWMFLAVFVSVDVLYLYEALAVLAYRYFGWKSYFIKDH